MIGRVIKFYNSFFFIKVENDLIPCKLRGIIKRDKKVGSAVCPGDFVEISKLKDGSGVIEKILPRKSLLSRPAVANVDRIILTFSAAQPDLHPLLLDRFIALAENSKLAEIIICINKIDLVEDKNFLSDYENLYRYGWLPGTQSCPDKSWRLKMCSGIPSPVPRKAPSDDISWNRITRNAPVYGPRRCHRLAEYGNR